MSFFVVLLQSLIRERFLVIVVVVEIASFLVLIDDKQTINTSHRSSFNSIDGKLRYSNSRTDGNEYK